MNEDYWTATAMITYGGNFVSKLGSLFLAGDFENRQIIKNSWSKLWLEYEIIGHHLKLEDDKKDQ